MTFNMEGLDISILGPACVAGLIVLSTHVPLGKQVLARGIIFIDLAIAQIAGLGVILAQYLGVDEHGFAVQVAAAMAALAGAGLLSWTDRRWPEYQEPLIGTPVSYTHLRAHETGRNLVCRLLLEKKK